MIRFDERIAEIVAADTTDIHERDPETFFASQMGFCPRQLYLSKLGLTATGERQGKYRVARLIQTYLEERLTEQYPCLEPGASLHADEGPIQFVGRCNLIDPEDGIVYALKARNGWHKFSPPVDRHLDQLHVYMHGLDAPQGRLIYISKNDLTDIREWPPPDEDCQYVAFDQERYDQLVEKATRIRDAIWTNGIATTPEDIPFQSCGCYFCQEERLAFPNRTTVDSADTSGPPSESDTDTPERTAGPDRSPSETTTDGQESTTTVETDGGPESHGRKTTVLDSDGVHVPADLRDLDVWVVWDEQSKVARAPWQEDTMYPCEWAVSKQIDPRRSFRKAQMVAELSVETIHQSWPFPDADQLPAQVTPAILLPHDPPTPPITFVDLDDVRNPDTGAVPREVVDLVNRLGGYAEVSGSGTGLHVYVRGSLPETMGMFTAPLAERGTIEMYDHSRFTGGTWRHVATTPLDTVPSAHGTMNDIIDTYRSHSQRRRNQNS